MATKPADLFDRDAAWTALHHAWTSPRPELVLAIGRRRAGKSFLLTRFAETHRGLYYQATRKTPREQLQTLSRTAGVRFRSAALRRGTAYPDWETFFTDIAERADGKPFVVVLDEFPYLVEADPALPSVLQALWDHPLRETRLKLILSGSYVSAMRQLTAADQPLYGRRTAELYVAPFAYHDAAAFVPAYSPADRLLTYGIFGGLPGHLALLDPAASLRDNAAQHLLTPGAPLYSEGGTLFDAFLGDAAVHYSVLEAVATGEQKFSKIANRVGKQASSVTRPLAWLQAMDVLDQIAPITAKHPPPHKLAIYRIRDPYLRFWHTFMSTVKSTGVANILPPDEVWDRFIAPGLADHMGAVFEDICRDFVRLDSTRRQRRLPIRAVRVGEWWNESNDQQVDLVALGASGELLVGECKWGTVTSADLDRLLERAPLVAQALPRVTTIQYALFAGRGTNDAALARRVDAGEALMLTPVDLFPNEPP